MLRGDNVAWLRLEPGTDLATPSAIFEALSQPPCLLNGRNILPGLVIAGTVSMMQRIENAKSRLPRRIQDSQHIRNTLISFCNSLQAIPYLAPLGNEVVIWIDHQKCSDFFVICQVCHALSSYAVR